MLPPEPALREPLVRALDVADLRVRAAALEVLRALRLGDAVLFSGALADSVIEVRIQAVRGLVSVDALDALAPATADPSREVRVATAGALATLAALATPWGGAGGSVVADAAAANGSGTATALRVPATADGQAAEARRLLAPLLRDPDPLVRAAALETLASAGCPPPLDAGAVTALDDAAWQVRKGAATALSAAGAGVAVAALTGALGDPHADVRKAAVLSLSAFAAREPAARNALVTVLADPDADVRAYAARGGVGHG